MAAAQKIKETKHWEVDVEVDFFHAKSGANRLVSGAFMGRTLIYSDLNHIVLRIQPKYASEAAENAILVSSHIDTVFAAYVFFSFSIYGLCFCQLFVISVSLCSSLTSVYNVIFFFGLNIIFVVYCGQMHKQFLDHCRHCQYQTKD